MYRVKEIKKIPSKIVRIFGDDLRPHTHTEVLLIGFPFSPSIRQFRSQSSLSLIPSSHPPFSLPTAVLSPIILLKLYHFLKLLCFLCKLAIFSLIAGDSLDKSLLVEGFWIVGGV